MNFLQCALSDEELPEGAHITPEGDLKLIRVINQDAGFYRCTAYNSVRTIQSDDIVLKVEGINSLSLSVTIPLLSRHMCAREGR